jgi:preprotein translocase subunit SecE
MGRQVVVVLYVVAMAAVIVGVDFVFFRNRFWERLTVNIGIVLVVVAFYLRFLRRP